MYLNRLQKEWFVKYQISMIFNKMSNAVFFFDSRWKIPRSELRFQTANRFALGQFRAFIYIQ